MFKIYPIDDFSKIENVESITMLIKKQFESYGVNKSSDDIIKSLKNALSPRSRSVLFILEVDKNIGFVFCNINSGLESGGDYIWINELFIDEDYRKCGYGNKLISYVELWCKSNNLVYMACSTGENNKVAQHFYTKLGYELSKTIWVDKSI
ncbi:MAG: GNAT family N-acetyltransferase [Spirochaetaceae bacterium]